MRILVPLVESLICLLFVWWLIYGYRRKSAPMMIAATLLLLCGLFMLASELIIDGFYREIRAGQRAWQRERALKEAARQGAVDE